MEEASKMGGVDLKDLPSFSDIKLPSAPDMPSMDGFKMPDMPSMPSMPDLPDVSSSISGGSSLDPTLLAGAVLVLGIGALVASALVDIGVGLVIVYCTG